MDFCELLRSAYNSHVSKAGNQHLTLVPPGELVTCFTDAGSSNCCHFNHENWLSYRCIAYTYMYMQACILTCITHGTRIYGTDAHASVQHNIKCRVKSAQLHAPKSSSTSIYYSTSSSSSS